MAVNELVTSMRAAVDHAEAIKQSRIPSDERSEVKTIQSLLAVAVNSGATDSERSSAHTEAKRRLEKLTFIPVTKRLNALVALESSKKLQLAITSWPCGGLRVECADGRGRHHPFPISESCYSRDMKITLLILHRKESYPGEFAPEVMASIDEHQMDENPSWWGEEVARQKAEIGAEANAWAEVYLEVPSRAIMDSLYPRNDVAATITGSSKLG